MDRNHTRTVAFHAHQVQSLCAAERSSSMTGITPDVRTIPNSCRAMPIVGVTRRLHKFALFLRPFSVSMSVMAMLHQPLDRWALCAPAYRGERDCEGLNRFCGTTRIVPLRGLSMSAIRKNEILLRRSHLTSGVPDTTKISTLAD